MNSLINLMFIALCVWAPVTWAQTDASYDDDAPDEDYVWVDGAVLDDKTVVKGYYRVRTRPGFVWVDGDFKGGVWVEGHWQPLTTRPNDIWVTGYVGPDGYYIDGHWRPRVQAGFTWVEPHFVGGVWIHGFWRPLNPRKGYVWVPGHRGPNGIWVSGFWRPSARSSFRWVEGHWRYGHWVPGHWAPLQLRPGHVWVAGYYGPKGWVDGFWRVSVRPGHYWVSSHWGPNGRWVIGYWGVGTRPVVHRHYARVYHPQHLYQTRAANRHLYHSGVHQQQQGRNQVLRGSQMEHRGEATGNQRLEHRGERMQERGNANIRQGKNKRRRAH